MEKKLTRSDGYGWGAGVLGGFGEYFGVDPVILRLAFAFITLATGVVPGVVIYILAIAIIPKKIVTKNHMDPFSRDTDIDDRSTETTL